LWFNKNILSNTRKTNVPKIVEYELDIQNKTKTFSAKLSVVKNKTNEESGVVVVVRDITGKTMAKKEDM